MYKNKKLAQLKKEENISKFIKLASFHFEKIINLLFIHLIERENIWPLLCAIINC